MKKIYRYVLDIFITLFLVYACYNLVPRAIQHFNYPVIMLVIFLHTYIVIQFFKFSIIESFVTILLVNLIIDASTLITGSNLIPLRFPFASIFPVVAFLIAVLWANKKRYWTGLLIIASILLNYFSYTVFVPRITSHIYERMNLSITQDSISRIIFSTKFLNTDSSINNIVRETEKVTLIENYFVGCAACEEKMPILDSMVKLYPQKLKIICICNGDPELNKFDQFKKHAAFQDSNVKFLYDYSRALSELKSYPLEILYDRNGKIVRVYNGFSKETQSVYLEKLLAILNTEK